MAAPPQQPPQAPQRLVKPSTTVPQRPVAPPVRPPAAQPVALRPATPAPAAAEVLPVVAPVEVPKVLPFTITSTNRVERFLKMLIYGAYGSGKTTWAASADDVESMRDVLFLDVEAGGLSIAERGIDSIRVTSYKQFAAIYEHLRYHCQLRDAGDLEALAKAESVMRGYDVTEPMQYRTVIIDSLSEVHKMLMYKLLGVTPGVTKLDKEPDSAEFKDWNQSAEMIRLLIRTFRDLPMNVLFVCSEVIVEDDKKVQHRRPNLPGKLGLEVMAFMDAVGYLVQATAAPGAQGNESTTGRRLYLQPGRTYQAKSRLSGDTVFLDDPTVAGLLALGDGRIQVER